ncbi:hypothetical protein BDV33DRAFT_178682 [Aspergillus novoparasiticus]|uniref:Uncharacterized protein n=1 Tax=Aspergillus novoparasiticus TaxID=986946 RepID=A0A5N6EGV7_9EURO|nr:hypothetical protein BDV33DRAFT_178682 [Aspergillus novoparasiticus]
MRWVNLFPLVCLVPTILTAIPCYFPDGSPAPWQHRPCNGDSTNAMCCGIGWGDTCQADGLCLGTNEQRYRGSCTDSTWQSDKCLGLCLNEGGRYLQTLYPIPF